MTRTVELVLAVGWAAFWLYWIAAAFSMKRGRIAWGHELGVRVVLAAVIVVAIRLGAFRGGGIHVSAWAAGPGLALFAAGLAFAVWARLHIGRNWGTPMTVKTDPELVTSGPYRLVRHPIYTGIIVALIGTAAALGWHWLVACGLVALYFVYSAFVEERRLTTQFPSEYPAYRRSTKMLVPFIL